MSTGEIVAIAVSVVALAMALPPIIQMIWGRPHITFFFNRVEDERDTLLLVHLYNLPVVNRALSGIGVRRDEAHFHANVIVRDGLGNLVLRFPDPSPTSGDPWKQNQHHLHAGPLPITLEVLGANDTVARTYYEPRKESYFEYKAGNYSIRIEVWVGEKMFFEEKTFVITAKPRNSYWVDQKAIFKG